MKPALSFLTTLLLAPLAALYAAEVIPVRQANTSAIEAWKTKSQEEYYRLIRLQPEMARKYRNEYAALAEIFDGSILYNSREHMSRGNCYFAWSHDGGDLWINASRSPDLPDGARGTSYGCMSGMIRLPIGGRDILIYSNLDTYAGEMPARVGACTSKGREKITVWASFDGGRTWPVKRLAYDGPSAYSNLGVGRTGTPSQGRVYRIFKGGPTGCYEAVQVVSFNLIWLLNGRDIAGFLGNTC